MDLKSLYRDSLNKLTKKSRTITPRTTTPRTMTPSSSSSVVVLFALSVVAMATEAETSVILLARLVKTRSVSGGSENEGNH